LTIFHSLFASAIYCKNFCENYTNSDHDYINAYSKLQGLLRLAV